MEFLVNIDEFNGLGCVVSGDHTCREGPLTVVAFTDSREMQREAVDTTNNRSNRVAFQSSGIDKQRQ